LKFLETRLLDEENQNQRRKKRNGVTWQIKLCFKKSNVFLTQKQLIF
jgi:hypothetical protein